MKKKRAEDGTTTKDANFKDYHKIRRDLFDEMDTTKKQQYIDQAEQEKKRLKGKPEREAIFK
jgi:iron uptake system EfeUOB component EfeO/EfeM